MTVAKEVKQIILKAEDGAVITYDDFSYLQNFNAVSKVLSRLARDGVIKRLEKGRYYKAGVTKFGEKGPLEADVVKSLAEGGYVSGNVIYNELGLTDQVPNEIVIIGKQYNRKKEIGNISIKYQKREGKFNHKSRKYLQILDAMKDIKKIPGVAPSEVLDRLIIIVKAMNMTEQERLAKYGTEYKPMVRALLGAIFDELGSNLSSSLEMSLNPLTNYNIGLKMSRVSTLKRWKIA
ncbi:MAG: hypothetical protein ISR65_19895 [Bacteriovoracaceae bacterium]|nr:hypothetical protein [Bacteriovoracaceae bacterium]